MLAQLVPRIVLMKVEFASEQKVIRKEFASSLRPGNLIVGWRDEIVVLKGILFASLYVKIGPGNISYLDC